MPLLVCGLLIFGGVAGAQTLPDGLSVLALRVDAGLARAAIPKVGIWLIHEPGRAPASPELAGVDRQTNEKGLVIIPLAASAPSHFVLDTLPEVNESVDVQTLLIPTMIPIGLVRNEHGKTVAATARSLSSFSDFAQAIDELDVLSEAITRCGNPPELAKLNKRVAWTKEELRRLKDVNTQIPRPPGVLPTGKRVKTTVSLVPVLLPWGAPSPPKAIQDPVVEKAIAAVADFAETLDPRPSEKKAGIPAPAPKDDPPAPNKQAAPSGSYEVESCYVFDAVGRPVPAPDWAVAERKDEIQLRLFPGAFYQVIVIPRVSRLSSSKEFAPDPVLISLCPSDIRLPTNRPPAPYDSKLLIRCHVPHELTDAERGVRIKRMQRLVAGGIELTEGVDRDRLRHLDVHFHKLMERIANDPPVDPRLAPRPIGCLVHLVKAAPDQEWQGFLKTVQACPDTHFWAVCDTTNPDQFAGFFPKLRNLHVLGHINFAAQTTFETQSAWALEARRFGAVGFLIDNYNRDMMNRLGPFLRQQGVTMIIARSESGIAEEEDIQSPWIDGVMSTAISETSYDSQSSLAGRQLLNATDPTALSPRVRLGMLDRSLMKDEDLESSFKKAIESRCELISFSPVGLLAPNGLPVAADQVQIPPAMFWKNYLSMLQKHNQQWNKHWANMADAGIVAP